MPWVIEDLAGDIDDTNRDFTVSHVPFPDTLLVFLKGTSLEVVGSQPELMETAYVQNSTAIELGLPPLVGQQVPWVRYFWQ